MNTTEQGAIISRLLAGVSLMTLDNGDEAIYINGEYITSTLRGEPSVADIARNTARAYGQPLRCLDLPAPDGAETCWEDVVVRLAQSASTTTARASVTVIESRLSAGRGFHFCGHPLLSGNNSNLWFPVGQQETLFEAVERVMVMNHQANNVVKIMPVREHHNGRDWEVAYNIRISLG